MEVNRTGDFRIVRSRRSQATTEMGSLEQRLNDGYERIEQALARGEDVSAWEAFWIDLLHQYEEASNPLSEAA
jgi:hypothetical protein